ncbi:hypothetical protein D5S10_28315 [Pseudomonas savastanoi]|uniref:Integrase n=2 Tax=Pseudomonas amygdali TaxID=47877 RepID=A0AAX1VX46_PSEAJ|nr:hypothetical protein A3SK_0111245 [Pseudomonas amygdali pv. tabaci str. 6605]KIY16372.1 hypothetical protein RD00_20830 [Pseudomonas amygdali pv. tabaci]KPX67877.1 hypothetical protein ALO35_200203 [Pseudomonas amygdali pv. lachrymans]QOI07382.1 hypothetical protein D5S10_28315 [Pseudomonas savastanoi]RML82465.1 hypothetical protein ALQ89_02931 [Pseudomonas amygdali pv. tabaci]
MVKQPANTTNFYIPCRLMVRPKLSLHEILLFYGSGQHMERRMSAKRRDATISPWEDAAIERQKSHKADLLERRRLVMAW